MAEAPRLNIVLLLIALANLATDITRLAVEWSPSHILHDAIKEHMGLRQRDAYGRAPDSRESDAARNDLQQKRAKPWDPGARGPPSDPRGSGPVPFPRLRPNYGTNRPSRCPGCPEPMRRFERSDSYGWRDFPERRNPYDW
jgi:hypothetical protein